jgi:DNA-binding NarL/FixJ family response regulator
VTDIRVVLQAVDQLSLAGLAQCLAPCEGFTVLPAREWTSATVAVVATDLWTPTVASMLRRASTTSRTRVILVIDTLAEADLLTAIECRVVAVLPRRVAATSALERTIRQAAVGGGVLSPEMVGKLMHHVEQMHREVLAPNGLTGSGLTAREIDVLRLMADGYDTAEIGSELCYSERTVKNVIYGITHRLNLRSRSHAVAYALRSGVV